MMVGDGDGDSQLVSTQNFHCMKHSDILERTVIPVQNKKQKF